MMTFSGTSPNVLGQKRNPFIPLIAFAKLLSMPESRPGKVFQTVFLFAYFDCELEMFLAVR